MGKLFEELKRRKVFRVAAVYALGYSYRSLAQSFPPLKHPIGLYSGLPHRYGCTYGHDVLAVSRGISD